MHSAVHLTCRLLIPVCVSLSLFLPHAETNAQDGLKLSLKFEDAEKGVPVIHLEKQLRMVISNDTGSDIKLPHPLSSSGYQNLKFTFTNRMNGRAYETQMNQTYDEDELKWMDRNNDSGQNTVNIKANSSLVVPIRFNNVLRSNPRWDSLPEPNPLVQYEVVASYTYCPTNDSEIHDSRIEITNDPEDVIVQSDHGNPVIATLRSGETDLSLRLLKLYPKWINKVGEDGFTPLIIAVREDHRTVVKWLLDNGADVNARRAVYRNTSPMNVASNIEMLALLIEHGGHIDAGPLTPLQNATEKFAGADNEQTRSSWKKIARFLIDKGAYYDIGSAVRLSDLARVKEIGNSNDVETQSDYNQSLRIAASHGHLAICKYLIEEKSADVNQFKEGMGFPVLMECMNHPKIVKLLIDNGADLETRITCQRIEGSGLGIIGDNATLLHHAASDASPETSKLLIEAGIDVLATDESSFGDVTNNQTALEVAAIFNQFENASLIIDSSQFKNAPQKVRQTIVDRSLLKSIVYCSKANHDNWQKLVELLLNHGANPNASDSDGNTPIGRAADSIVPLEIPRNQVLKKMINLLRQYGGELTLNSAVKILDPAAVAEVIKDNPEHLEARDYVGYPAIQFAIQADNQTIVNLLLDAGADPNIKNKAKYNMTLGDQPLHVAAQYNRHEICRMLIDAGADVNSQNSQLNTPLHRAVEYESLETIKLLLKSGAAINVKNNDGETPLELLDDPANEDGRFIQHLFYEHAKNK